MKKYIKCPFKKAPGVYKIVNINTQDFYIGASKNVYIRYYSHWARMAEGKHDNAKIRNHVALYGRDSFYLEVLEYCDEDVLHQREQFYFDSLKPTYNAWNNIYNATGRKYSDEQLASFQGRTYTIKDKKAFSDKLKKSWAKRRYKPETIAMLEKIKRTGKKHTQETLIKMSNQRFGKPKSEAMREKLSKWRTGTQLINGKFIKIEQEEGGVP